MRIFEITDLEKRQNSREHGEALEKTGFWGNAGAGCIFIAKSTGRILLNHRSKYVEQPNTWGVWGGAIDRGEDPKEAVRREASEEAGFNIGNNAIIPLYVFKSGTFQYSNFAVMVDDEFEPNPGEEDAWETQGWKWCDLNDFPSPLHFGVEALLKDAASMATIKKLSTPDMNLTEGKIAPLYHGTTIFDAVQILKSGVIKPSEYTGHVSLTRNPKLWFGDGEAGFGNVQFVIDQHKLSHNHKIRPTDYYFNGEAESDSPLYDEENSIRNRRSESEERVNKAISLKYVKEIWISNSVEDDYRSESEEQDDDFIMVELKRDLNAIIKYAKMKNIPVKYMKK